MSEGKQVNAVTKLLKRTCELLDLSRVIAINGLNRTSCSVLAIQFFKIQQISCLVFTSFLMLCFKVSNRLFKKVNVPDSTPSDQRATLASYKD